MITRTVSPDSSMQLTDAELVVRSRRGEQKAFAHLVNRYLPAVYNHLYRMTQNHELSEEMAQEAFVKAYQALSSFDVQRTFKPWLLRIASNAAISELRKQSKIVSLNALEEAGNWGEANHPLAQTDSLSQVERALSSQEVMQALALLEPKYREVLLLRYQQDLSYEEVAQALNVPINTVRTWLKRGLEKLKQAVKEAEL